jgi:hypothetical protein
MIEAKLPENELRWNIMSRFRDYVREIPDGAETWVSESGGIHEGELIFIAEDRVGLKDFPWRFKGAVRYEAYRGALRVDISDPEISAVDDGILITVNTSPPGVAEYRIPLASTTSSSASDQKVWAASTALTTEGAGLFGGVYQSGEPADGFTVWLRQTSEV